MKQFSGAYLAVAMALFGGKIGQPHCSFPTTQWKPKFTGAELDQVRTLPKREREREVKRLREKYRVS